ncbi:hypothetical protein NL676_019011 [Syzygium grande]|nr:hypothetical protein NL676_019011 [Syzygium grande]
MHARTPRSRITRRAALEALRPEGGDLERWLPSRARDGSHSKGGTMVLNVGIYRDPHNSRSVSASLSVLDHSGHVLRELVSGRMDRNRERGGGGLSLNV